MLLELKAQIFGDISLTLFDGLIHKLFHMTAVNAYQVVVVLTLVEFIYGSAITLAGLKMAAQEESRPLKLGENPINRSQPDFFIFFGQSHKDIFSAKVGATILMKKIEDFHPWSSGFKANIS
jgi:hypothetical protein